MNGALLSWFFCLGRNLRVFELKRRSVLEHVRSRGNDPKVGCYVTLSLVLLWDKLQGQKATAFPSTFSETCCKGQNSHRNIQWPGGLLKSDFDMKCRLCISGYLGIYQIRQKNNQNAISTCFSQTCIPNLIKHHTL